MHCPKEKVRRPPLWSDDRLSRWLYTARFFLSPSRSGFSKSYRFAAFHSGVLTFIQPDRVPDR
jgi:hypothetical protein